MPLNRLTRRILLKRKITIPPQLFHPLFRRIVRPNNPLLQILKRLFMILRKGSKRLLPLPPIQFRKRLLKLPTRHLVHRPQRRQKTLLTLRRIHTQQQINELIHLRAIRPRHHRLRHRHQQLILFRIQKNRPPIRRTKPCLAARNRRTIFGQPPIKRDRTCTRDRWQNRPRRDPRDQLLHRLSSTNLAHYFLGQTAVRTPTHSLHASTPQTHENRTNPPPMVPLTPPVQQNFRSLKICFLPLTTSTPLASIHFVQSCVSILDDRDRRSNAHSRLSNKFRRLSRRLRRLRRLGRKAPLRSRPQRRHRRSRSAPI